MFERQLALQRECTASSGLARVFPIIIVTIIVVSVVVIISVIINLIFIVVIIMFITIVVIVIIIKTSDFNKFAASAGLGSHRQRGESGVRNETI